MGFFSVEIRKKIHPSKLQKSVMKILIEKYVVFNIDLWSPGVVLLSY